MQHLLYAQPFTLKQKLDARSDMSLFWYAYRLCVILNITDESVAPDTTAASPKVPAQGLPAMVSLSRNENENSWCHSSPSQRWEGKMKQHAEPNSPAAKDKSSYSWIRLLETPRPILNRWLITLSVVTASCFPLVSLILCTLRWLHVSTLSAAGQNLMTSCSGLTCISQKEPLLPTNFWCIFIVYKKQSKCLSKSHFKDRGLPCALHMKIKGVLKWHSNKSREIN